MGRPPGLTPDGAKIRRLRVGLGLSAAQLAPHVPLHPKTLMAIESTSRPISDVTASRIARALTAAGEPVTMADITSREAVAA
jgi:DNA-binding XRE family transcriptional regulator